MATARNAYTALTLAEQANRIDPKGNMAKIAEILTETNEILLDAPFLEANNTWAHTVVRRSNLPSGSWRNLNDGVTASSSQTNKVHEMTAMLEDYSISDKALVDSMPNPMQYRMDQARAHIEGMGQTLAATIIYGNHETDPEKFTGLAPRMATLDNYYIISNGGSTTLTSIFIVQWGPGKAYMIYPRGHRNLGIEHEDLGEDRVSGITSSTYFQAYVDHFKSYCGLAVEDPRCIARVCNIDVGTATYLFNEDKLIETLNNMPQAGRGASIYVNRAVKTQMEIALKDKTNVNFSVGDGLGGVPVLQFRGLPVRLVDQILNSESAIS